MFKLPLPVLVLVIVHLLYAFAAKSETAPTVQFRLGTPLTAYHVGYSDPSAFNSVNLGLTATATFRPAKSFQYGLTLGGYWNSTYDRTLFVAAFADFPIVRANSGAQIRAGAFTGLFEYPEIAASVHGRWPTVGDYVLAIGPHVKFRTPKGIDYTIAYIPSGNSRGVLTLSIAIPL